MKIIRMKDVAMAAGVDASTVSLALRGDPRIAAATREKVKAAAEKLGYQRDPALSALAETRWRSETRVGTGNWAVMAESDEEGMHNGRFGSLFAQAGERGYALEVVRLTKHSSAQKINRELKARGVRGILLLPLTQAEVVHGFDWSGLDWGAFSWVALNEAYYPPPVHRVLFNAFRDTRIALRAMVERGWRRIAFVHETSSYSRVNARQQAAGLQFAMERPDVELRLIEIGKAKSKGVMKHVKMYGVADDAEKYSPQAVLLGYTGMRASLPVAWKALPWATLTLWKNDAKVAGLFLDQTVLCEEAADQLDFMCRRRETGIPARRRTVLVDSEWNDGESLGRME